MSRLVLVLLVAGIHAGAWLEARPVPVVRGDASEYLLLAENVAEGGGFSLSEAAPHEPTATRVPGYPLFLLAATLGFRLPLDVVAALQVAMAVGLALLLHALLATWGVGPVLAVLGAALGASLPTLAYFSFVLLTETLSTFLGAVAVAVAALGLTGAGAGRARLELGGRRVPVWGTAGLLLGAASLVRPEYPAFLAGFAFLPFLQRVPWRSRLRDASVVLACGAVVLVPWIVRNGVRFERIIVTAARFNAPGVAGNESRGYARWVMTWIDHPRWVEDAVWDPFGREQPPELPSSAFSGPQERASVEELLASADAPPAVGSPTDSAFDAMASRARRERPASTFLLVPFERIASTWTHLPTYLPSAPPGFPGDVASLLRPAMLLKLFLGGVGGLLLLGGVVGTGVAVALRFVPAAPFALLLAFRSALVGWVIYPEARYVLQAVPAAAVLAALAGAWTWGRLTGRGLGGAVRPDPCGSRSGAAGAMVGPLEPRRRPDASGPAA